MQQVENPDAATDTSHRGHLRGARSPSPVLLSHSGSYQMSLQAAAATAFYIKKRQDSSVIYLPSVTLREKRSLKQKVKVKVVQSCPTLCDPMDCLYSPWDSPGQNTGVGSLSLFQAIFPTQESNPGLPHGRWILYQLSYKGSPKTLEWISYPFSRESSRPRNQTRVS